MNMPLQRVKDIAFVSSQTDEAREAYARLEKRYGNCDTGPQTSSSRSAATA